jgi:hypothetical protein
MEVRERVYAARAHGAVSERGSPQPFVIVSPGECHSYALPYSDQIQFY